MPGCRYKSCSKPAEEGSEYCILHKPGEKDASQFYGLIRAKMERQDYYFHGYVFPPHADFRGAKFQGVAFFGDATFEGIANFDEAIFMGDACFEGTTFERTADFTEATFEGRADFESVTLEQDASFEGAACKGEGYFRRATFKGDALFDHRTFQQDTDFHGATFEGLADFGDATFKRGADFHYVHCNHLLLLAGTNFERPADETTACRLAQVTYRRFGDEDTAAEYYLRKKRAETASRRLYDPLKYVGWVLDVLSRYGESPILVVIWILGIIGGGAVWYWQSKRILHDVPVGHDFGFWDALYFSIVTFTTLGYGDWYPDPESLIRYVANVEAVFGASLMALLVATVVRKWMR